MLPFSTTIVHGVAISVIFTFFALISFYYNPRLWLHSLPADIRNRVPPKSSDEEKQTMSMLMIYIAILPGLSTLSTIYVATSNQMNLTLAAAFTHLYGIWIIVHVWDLLVIDGVYMLVMDPGKPPIAGTENAEGWSDYSFHVAAFGKAVFMSLLFVLPAAVLLSALF